ncbi:MAG: hypothetical protein VXZ82_21205 [Planctomycetota bacterium]|nr:hypothetical protein [Planctomycetota bacterium]
MIDGVFKIEGGAKEWSTMFPDKSLRLVLRRRGTKNLEFFIEDEPTYEITYRVFRGEVGRAGAVFSEQLCKLMLAAAELRPESAEKRRSIALG